MGKRFEYKFSIHKFTLCILLLMLITLAACADKENSKDASSKEEKEENQTAKIDNQFSQLEEEFDAELGVYAVDTETNQAIEYQSEERFAFASTYKALAAAIVLQQNSMEELNQVITYTKEDLVPYSPVTEKHVDSGMTLLNLAEAAVRTSDNTAGNLLFNAIGGPKEFEQTLREIGDNDTQAERYEPDLNQFSPEDPRDTSTPKALATSLQAFALGDLLPNEKREQFTDWLQGNATGDTLIRAGAPEGWEVGDKSGAGSYGTRNDIAVVWPPNREPIVIAIMSRHDTEDATYDDALIAQAAKVALNALN
ncbi:class A beta-lactamase [Bacilli bacterium]|uniref:class A beta-lactamase n=1 Tax=Oceanobacillus sp. FSL K6-0118 TaxID=2921418 RepID=UPI000622AAC7|nr:beta-lactamase [Bacilli bacterium VT-13-104]PZD87942.1 class A beta-lactamase [Bacilli bacterium]PZD90133.1 class A beta-lactamase [Bacilli bacterium]PZD92027.1 class A beta-lactamase [Bacilli bacterium]RCO06911.1 class A beta-lactamase [Bacilli bacterium]